MDNPYDANGWGNFGAGLLGGLVAGQQRNQDMARQNNQQQFQNNMALQEFQANQDWRQQQLARDDADRKRAEMLQDWAHMDSVIGSDNFFDLSPDEQENAYNVYSMVSQQVGRTPRPKPAAPTLGLADALKMGGIENAGKFGWMVGKTEREANQHLQQPATLPIPGASIPVPMMSNAQVLLGGLTTKGQLTANQKANAELRKMAYGMWQSARDRGDAQGQQMALSLINDINRADDNDIQFEMPTLQGQTAQQVVTTGIAQQNADTNSRNADTREKALEQDWNKFQDSQRQKREMFALGQDRQDARQLRGINAANQRFYTKLDAEQKKPENRGMDPLRKGVPQKAYMTFLKMGFPDTVPASTAVRLTDQMEEAGLIKWNDKVGDYDFIAPDVVKGMIQAVTPGQDKPTAPVTMRMPKQDTGTKYGKVTVTEPGKSKPASKSKQKYDWDSEVRNGLSQNRDPKGMVDVMIKAGWTPKGAKAKIRWLSKGKYYKDGVNL